jgi:hypothetical protein
MKGKSVKGTMTMGIVFVQERVIIMRKTIVFMGAAQVSAPANLSSIR